MLELGKDSTGLKLIIEPLDVAREYNFLKVTVRKGARRIINVLCPAGKAFTRILWEKDHTVKRDYAYGFTKGRRREQAILIANCTKWRIEDLRLNYNQSLHDVANAFPSLKQEKLNQMIDERVHEDDRPFLKAKHMTVIIHATDPCGRRLYYKAGQRGLQGDSVMAPEFGHIYEEVLENWTINKGGMGLYCEDPIAEKVVNTGTQIYADDISDINVLQGADWKEIAEGGNQELNTSINVLGLYQNQDKEEHMIMLQGRNSVKDTQKIIEGHEKRKEGWKTNWRICSGC